MDETTTTREAFRAQHDLLRRYRRFPTTTVPMYLVRPPASADPHQPELPQDGPPPGPEAGAGSGPASPADDLTLAGAARDLRAGRLAARDLVARCLGQIRRLNPTLNAFVTVREEAAFEAAAALDRDRAAGRIAGPLHGVPICVKDVIHVAGVRTTASSRVLPDLVPAQNATAVARLVAAGAILIGKTHTHEFALGVSTPQSRNPWDPARLAGGSSGGSAIAVAAGMALGSVNTDTRGSIRVPSALCGLVGLKPTFGLVPKTGVLTLSWTMDHIGPITRTVEDAALMLSLMAGPDPQDPTCVATPGTDYTQFLHRRLKGLRLGIPEVFLAEAAPEVLRAFRRSTECFRDLGTILVELDEPKAASVRLCSAAGLIVSRCEAASFHENSLRTPEAPSTYTPDVYAQLDEAYAVPAVDYLRALRYRSHFVAEVRDLFTRVDALATPTCLVAAPRAADAEAVVILLARNSIPWSFGGFPTLNFPIGVTDTRLPISTQLIAPHFHEATLLALAAAYERTSDFALPAF